LQVVVEPQLIRTMLGDLAVLVVEVLVKLMVVLVL
jgi:hypothetical protein